MKHLTHVKWISSNDPMIKIFRNDARLHVSKRELKDLHERISEFLENYSSEFTEDRIDIQTSLDNSEDWNLA